MKTKYEIELPTLPDGRELVCNEAPVSDDLILYWASEQWEWKPSTGSSTKYPFIARRKRTLADWANDQKRFMQFAAMRDGLPTYLVNDGIHGWQFNGHTLHLYEEANDKTGKLTLKNGKWEDAT